ncbi:MAG: CcdB family protein [bacterium]|nr:CcdB family protein [bacterium]
MENTTVVLHPLEIVSVDVNNLGKLVASLSEHSQQIADALDMLITRAHG